MTYMLMQMIAIPQEQNATTDGLRSKDITTVNMVDLTAIGTSAPTVENMVAITNHGWYHTLADAGLGRSGTNVDSALTNGIARYKVLSSFAAIKILYLPVILMLLIMVLLLAVVPG